MEFFILSFVGAPHRKQFVIGKATSLGSCAWPKRFQTLALDNGLQFRCCPELRHVSTKNHKNQTVLLIGTVVESRENRPEPAEALANLTLDQVASVTESWTGHWLLLIGDELCGDFCGLFSVYMPREGLLQQSGQFVVSNSPALMADFYGLPAMNDRRVLQPFQMAPWSFRPELRCLMAGEVLNLRTSGRQPCGYPIFIEFDIDLGEIRSRVAQMVSTSVARLQQLSSYPVLCALSAGYDSRLNLAAAISTGLPFEAYTFVKSYFYITEADRLLPPTIARVVGATHKSIKSKPADAARAEGFLKHSGGCIATFAGNGFDHYVHRYWEQAGEGRYVLDGQCYELAVNYHRKKFRADFELQDLRKFGFGLGRADYDDIQQHWRRIGDLSAPLDRRDLLFWTGNINGFYARMTQEHDLFADLFYTACNRLQMNLLLSVPVELREACLFQATITASLAPALDLLPYNPPEPFSKRVIKRIRNEVIKRLAIRGH